MEFARPDILYALFLIPLLVLLLMKTAGKRRSELLLFAGGNLMDGLSPGRSWRRGLLKNLLLSLAGAVMVVAIAGPRLGSRLVKVEREGIDIVVALDTSLSMLAEDIKPNRLERAKMEIIDLIRGLKGDRVGIVVFAGDAFALCPLTVDYDAALMFANAIDVNMVSEPGTALSRAISASTALFDETSRHDKAVIIITDGESHEGDPIQQAKLSRDMGTKIYTIGIGNPSGEPIPIKGSGGKVEGYKKDNRGETVMTRLNEDILIEIARSSGGRYMPATREGMELKIIYGEIEGMEKKKIKGEFMERKQDRFTWFLAAAFFMLVVELLVSSGKSSRSREGKKILHTGALVFLMCLALAAPPSAFSKSINRGKNNAANKYYAGGAYDKALALYNDAWGDSTKNPRHFQGLSYNKGNTLHMMGRYKEALGLYRQAFEAGDSLLAGSALHNRGNTFMKMNMAKEAVASYVDALNYIPDDSSVINNLEIALRNLKNEEKQKQKQEQDQKQRNKEDNKKSSKDKSGERNQQQENQDSQEQNKSGQNQKEFPDSSSAANSAGPDSSGGRQQKTSPKNLKLMSKQDALRILQALEEREKNLQKKKRQAAFKKIKKSGKDW